MWDMRRNLNIDPPPERRTVIEFLYPELPSALRKCWLIVEPDGTVDLYVDVDLRTFTEIWIGLKALARAVDDGVLLVTGRTDLANTMQIWLGLGPFAV